ncbi:FR47-like protein [Bryocella elongata]|uniref:FR47-like protein n=1 Tax=Bryocella elongata TaxID=863522 RepID=A0A1H6AMB4_9BACT|nr:GNAT family N-acetyltransferase [Bryocella elongata]SEG49217.1 FR47-like protein [Bryocella elongata]
MPDARPTPPPEATDDRFANTALTALRSSQAHLADAPGEHMLRYRPDVSPFVCLLGDPEAGLTELAGRMAPGELEWVLHPTADPLLAEDRAGAWAEAHGVRLSGFGGVSQMVFPAEAPIPEGPGDDEVVPMSGPEAGQEMVDLTTAAFPGFFRIRTNAMGPYFGIRREGRLIAMGGDRMCFGEFREVSGICTLPEYRGQGLASAIIRRILREHRTAGYRSYLHLGSTNTGARRIYEQLGFVFNREVFCTRVFKPEEAAG